MSEADDRPEDDAKNATEAAPNETASDESGVETSPHLGDTVNDRETTAEEPIAAGDVSSIDGADLPVGKTSAELKSIVEALIFASPWKCTMSSGPVAAAGAEAVW